MNTNYYSFAIYENGEYVDYHVLRAETEGEATAMVEQALGAGQTCELAEVEPAI